VILTEKTIVIGDISLGSLIEVEGLTTLDGWIEAHELHLREYEFVGQVESIEFDFWIISNVKFEIVPSTQIYSGAQAGDDVLVLARTRDDGTQYALAIIRLPSYMGNPGTSGGEVASLTAGKNEGEELELSGKVIFISSSYWVIDGYTVMVSLQTEVNEDINLGDFVKVHALVGEDGSLIAREVELGSNDIGHDQNDDDLEDEMFEDEQGSDDDSDQNTQDDDPDQEENQGDSDDNSGNGEDESDDNEEEEDSSDEDNEDSSDDEDSSSDDDIEDDVVGDDVSESDGDEVEDDEEPEETEEPED
jgi:hypothetical protein